MTLWLMIMDEWLGFDFLLVRVYIGTLYIIRS